MILPDKNILLSHSLLGMGSIILNHLKSFHTVSSLWEKVKNTKEINSFEKYILTLDLLYIMGLIEFHEGLLRKKNHA